MVDPTQGFKVDSLYRAPVNALLEHPSLFLVGVAGGLLLAILAPDICVVAFFQRRCIIDIRRLGAVMAIGSLLPYVYMRYRRDVSD